LLGKAALDELRRAIGDLALRGVTITSQVKGLSQDAPELYDPLVNYSRPFSLRMNPPGREGFIA